MFSVHCPRHGARVLLGHRQILGIDGHGQDLAIRWECWCGHRGVIRRSQPAVAARAALPAAAAV